MISSERISGAKGSYLLSQDGTPTGGSVSNVNYTSFYVRESTVISSITGIKLDGSTVDFNTTLNISNSTLVQGDFFVVPIDSFITNVTLTSGSIILY